MGLIALAAAAVAAPAPSLAVLVDPSGESWRVQTCHVIRADWPALGALNDATPADDPLAAADKEAFRAWLVDAGDAPTAHLVARGSGRCGACPSPFVAVASALGVGAPLTPEGTLRTNAAFAREAWDRWKGTPFAPELARLGMEDDVGPALAFRARLDEPASRAVASEVAACSPALRDALDPDALRRVTEETARAAPEVRRLLAVRWLELGAVEEAAAVLGALRPFVEGFPTLPACVDRAGAVTALSVAGGALLGPSAARACAAEAGRVLGLAAALPPGALPWADAHDAVRLHRALAPCAASACGTTEVIGAPAAPEWTPLRRTGTRPPDPACLRDAARRALGTSDAREIAIVAQGPRATCDTDRRLP